MKNHLIIVADLGNFKAYMVTTDPQGVESPSIDLVKSFDSIEAHKKLSEQLSDSAGRFKRAAGDTEGERAGYGEQHNIGLENERRLIRNTAGQINSLIRMQGYKRWNLAASEEINKRLMDELDGSVAESLDKNIKADLTKASKAELLERFE